MGVSWREATSPTFLVGIGNIVENGDFESGQLYPWVGSASIVTDAYEGLYCLELPPNGYVEQTLPITVNIPESFEVSIDKEIYGSVENPPSFDKVSIMVEGELTARVDNVLVSATSSMVFNITGNKEGQLSFKLGDTPITIKKYYYSHTHTWHALLCINGLWLSLPSNILSGWHTLEVKINGRPDYITNGDFEAGTLEPWEPVLGAYSYCTTLTRDAHRGQFCLKAGPTRMAHGATYCGVKQGINSVTSHFIFRCAFKKDNIYKKDLGRIALGDYVINIKGIGDGRLDFEFMGWHFSSDCRTDWNELVVSRSIDDHEYWVFILNQGRIGATVFPKQSLPINKIEVGTGTGDEYEGATWYFDTISLKEY